MIAAEVGFVADTPGQRQLGLTARAINRSTMWGQSIATALGGLLERLPRAASYARSSRAGGQVAEAGLRNVVLAPTLG
jgi:hypothetical protein